ncbi:hypothetical protein [Sphingomonas sp.]|jgi:hypothetical protein|uniref:hypothetical protein n=1 Tax=Sphingomonas sp. TaxID=28214 RepID=UPI002EDA9127
MLVPRTLIVLAAGVGLLAAAPASAQFFLKPANLAGAPVTGAEPGMTGPALPGATPVELRAALVWNLRAALNVAALQCQFEPTLLTLDYYNAALKDHSVELRTSYVTLEKYFARTAADKKAGQTELDKFGTRVYSGFSTVGGQLSFCQTAGSIGRDALFTRVGRFGDLAESRMRELRQSLLAWGEQYRAGGYRPQLYFVGGALPPFGNDKCWKKDSYQPKKCGPLPAG